MYTSTRTIEDFDNLFPRLNISLMDKMIEDDRELMRQGKIDALADNYLNWLRDGMRLKVNINLSALQLLCSSDICFLSAVILRKLAERKAVEVREHNPVVSDKLQLNAKLLKECYDEYSHGIDFKEERDDMMDLLYAVENHEAIGLRLGLDAQALGVYDSLAGVFSETFYPDLIDTAKELTPYIYNARDKERPIGYEEFVSEFTDIMVRNQCYLDNRQLTIDYITNDILKLNR